MLKGNGVQTTGRRKSSRARVYLREGSGNFVVNGKTLADYFGRETLQSVAQEPLVITEKAKEFDVLVNVRGGGKSGQANAIRHGIARALDLENPDLHDALKKAKFLTRDPREVERKKFGRHKARKKPQFSKR